MHQRRAEQQHWKRDRAPRAPLVLRLARHPLVKLRENHWPGLFVPLLRFFIRKSCVRQPQMRATFVRVKPHRHHGFSAVGCAGEPGNFHQPVAVQPQESSVMRMPRSSELGLEKKEY
jgi:hypothetical protein